MFVEKDHLIISSIFFSVIAAISITFTLIAIHEFYDEPQYTMTEITETEINGKKQVIMNVAGLESDILRTISINMDTGNVLETETVQDETTNSLSNINTVLVSYINPELEMRFDVQSASVIDGIVINNLFIPRDNGASCLEKNMENIKCSPYNLNGGESFAVIEEFEMTIINNVLIYVLPLVIITSIFLLHGLDLERCYCAKCSIARHSNGYQSFFSSLHKRLPFQKQSESEKNIEKMVTP